MEEYVVTDNGDVVLLFRSVGEGSEERSSHDTDSRWSDLTGLEEESDYEVDPGMQNCSKAIVTRCSGRMKLTIVKRKGPPETNLTALTIPMKMLIHFDCRFE